MYFQDGVNFPDPPAGSGTGPALFDRESANWFQSFFGEPPPLSRGLPENSVPDPGPIRRVLPYNTDEAVSLQKNSTPLVIRSPGDFGREKIIPEHRRLKKSPAPIPWRRGGISARSTVDHQPDPAKY